MSKPQPKTPRKQIRKAASTGSPGTSRSSQSNSVDEFHPETVLLAVTGMSPAILTETLWALAHEPEPILPSRIYVVTTIAGRAELYDKLFEASPRFSGLSPWDCLRQCVDNSGCDLSARWRFGSTGDDIRVITALDPKLRQSRELADIRTPSDNRAAADFLLDQIRGLVANPDVRLVVSLAGGRKTMGTLAYACMTLVGRDDDRITHVLVNEPFDTLRDFWFPGQPGGHLTDRQGAAFNPRAAQIELADVPFVPMRNLFHKELGRPAGGFMRLVDSCRESVRRRVAEELRVTIHATHTKVEVNGAAVNTAPREHIVLLFLAARLKRGHPTILSYKQAQEPLNAFRETIKREASSLDRKDWRTGKTLDTPFIEQDIRRSISALKQRFKGRGDAAQLFADALPEKGRFSLNIPQSLVFLR